MVERGVLCPVLCDVYSARKLGRQSTGSSARAVGGNPGPTTSNLIMQAGSMTRQELLRSTHRGLYVTQLMGFGFNPVTGDFSRGAQGFWIENGELTYPVGEVTIAANFDDILKRIDAVADDLQLRSSTAAPTFRVSQMTLAGTSKN
jgi:PmbA protein